MLITEPETIKEPCAGSRLLCPRCGYDLQGAMLQWTDSCPLEEKCNECGLEFLCRDVLRPRYHAPKWLIEVEAGWKKRPVQIVVTFLRAWFPPLFWSRIGMAMPFRRSRLAFSVFAMLAAAFVCIWLPLVFVAGATFDESSADLARKRDTLIQHMQRDVIAAQILRDNPKLKRNQSEVPPTDIESLKRIIDELKALDPTEHFFEHIAKQLFTPYSEECIRGTLSVEAHRELLSGPHSPGGIWPWHLQTSSQAMHRLLPRHRLKRLTDNGAHIVTIGWLAVMIGMPIYLIALPMTRRKAKVQIHHIARVAAYGIVFPLSWLPIWGTIIAMHAILGHVDDDWFWSTYKVMRLVILPWAALWWFCAIRQYLRLPHAAAIVATGFIILFGLGPGLFALLNPHTLIS